MNIDEITDFTYSRNELWRKTLTKQWVREFFTLNENNIITERIKGKLVLVAFYLILKDELHFITVTVKEGIKATPILLHALKKSIKKTGVHWVSWYTPEYKLKRWEVNKQCQ